MNNFELPKTTFTKGNITTCKPMLLSDIAVYFNFLGIISCKYANINIYPNPHNSDDYKKWFNASYENLLKVIGADIVNSVSFIQQYLSHNRVKINDIHELENILKTNFQTNIIFDSITDMDLQQKSANLLSVFKNFINLNK